MSSNRKRKKATRHQPVARRGAGTAPAASVAEIVPARVDGQATSRVGPGEAAAPSTAVQTARGELPVPPTSLATISDAIDTMVHALDVEPARRLGATSHPEPTKSRGDVESPPWDDHDEDPDGGDHEGYEEGVPARGARRRRTIAVAVAAPLMFAGAFVAGGWIIKQVQDPPSRVGLASVPPSAIATPSAPVEPQQSATGRFVPGEGVGPGLTEPGALVQATPTADGSLEVVERVRFAAPVSKLSLGPPLTKGVAARSLPSAVEVLDLQMQANDAVVDIGLRRLTKHQTVVLPGDTSTVVMRYRLIGASVRSIPSTPGRALTLLPPITSPATLGSIPFVIEVSGAQVTNMVCPGLPAKVQLCGQTWTLGWYSSPQRPGRTAVLAQLNLPDPVSS